MRALRLNPHLKLQGATCNHGGAPMVINSFKLHINSGKHCIKNVLFRHISSAWAYSGGLASPPFGCEKTFVLIFNVNKFYAKIWTLLKMYNRNAPPPLQISKYATEAVNSRAVNIWSLFIAQMSLDFGCRNTLQHVETTFITVNTLFIIKYKKKHKILLKFTLNSCTRIMQFFFCNSVFLVPVLITQCNTALRVTWWVVPACLPLQCPPCIWTTQVVGGHLCSR